MSSQILILFLTFVGCLIAIVLRITECHGKRKRNKIELRKVVTPFRSWKHQFHR